LQKPNFPDLTPFASSQSDCYYHKMLRHARRIIVLVVGMTVLLFGIALLVLPGPAFVVIPIGLAILATEYAWARRWLNTLKESAEKGAEKLNLRAIFSRRPKSNARGVSPD
jgi:tellurite resistance protein TerC